MVKLFSCYIGFANSKLGILLEMTTADALSLLLITADKKTDFKTINLVWFFWLAGWLIVFNYRKEKNRLEKYHPRKTMV